MDKVMRIELDRINAQYNKDSRLVNWAGSNWNNAR
jgi:hypothetical protein